MLRPVAVGVAILAALAIALAACSGGDQSDAGVPATEVLPEATSTVVATAASSPEAVETTPTKEPSPSATSLSTPEKAAVREVVQPPPTTHVSPVHTQSTVTPDPTSLVALSHEQEFPDDLILYMGTYAMGFAERVYKKDGEIISEPFFTLGKNGLPDIDEAFHDRYHVTRRVTPDISRSVLSICHQSRCDYRSMTDPVRGSSPSTDLYESTDTGSTWSHLGTLSGTWQVTWVSPDSSDVLLYGGDPSDPPFNSQSDWEYRMYPGGESLTVEQAHDLTGGLYSYVTPAVPRFDSLEINEDRLSESHPNVFMPSIWLSDTELLGWPGTATGAGGGFGFSWDPGGILLIYNVETDELSHFYSAEPNQLGHFHESLSDRSLGPVVFAIQHGSFLRVVGIDGGCLPIRSDPSPDAEELACMAERVLLQDQGESVEVVGTIWRRAKTPSGFVGWADGRYLE